MDSDEEYERRRGRDKFRRERSDYNDRRERDDRRRGDDWGDRRRDRGEVRRDWNRRDYNDYDRGARRDRYSPPRGRDMSPPNKRMRRDWGDGGGYQGGYNDMGYGGPGGYGGGPQGGWGPPQGRGRNRRGGGPDIDPTGPMMSFKAFLAAQDDNIDDQEAVRKYNEYKMEYKKAQLSEFFLAHKDEEWFRFKYYPDEADKRRDEMLAAVRHRLVVFLDTFERGLVDDARAEADSAVQIVKLLDAAVIKMEGGTELDMTILDQPPSPKPTPNRQRSTSERERRMSEMSEKGTKDAEEKKTSATDGEDGEVKSDDGEKKEKTEEKKEDDDKEKKEVEEGKTENGEEKSDEKEKEDKEKEGEDKKDEKEKEQEEEKEKMEEEEKKEESPPEPKEPPPEPEPEKRTGPTLEERKQHSVSDVLKRLMMGGSQRDNKDQERSPRHDRKRKRKRDYSSDESHSGSSSDSFSSSSSGSSSESSDSEDERHDRDKKGKKHRKDSKASDGKPVDKEGEVKEGEKDDKEEEREEGEKEPEEPKPRALHKTYSLFVRNVVPVITKAEIVALCKRYPGFMRVALAEPQAERNFQRHGWITFDRSVNIKEICWNLSSIRLRDCELSPVVNRELSNRVRSVSGITAHKTVVRADLKLAARLVQQLDDKNKLWREMEFDKKEEKEKDKEGEKEKEKDGEEPPKEESVDLLAKFKRNPVLENITEYLVEEASAEEEVLLGASADPTEDPNKDSTAEVMFEKDEELNKVLDRLLFYLRVVHSVDYYTGSQYHIEDEMPNRCGIMHVRGSNPPNRITEKDLDNWEKHFETKLSSLLNTSNDLNDDEVVKLGKKDQEAEVEKFVKANTQELAKDKWLCPLSGKKFKGPEFVRKHIFNKHGDKVEDVKKEVTFFNNYLKDPRRPQIPDPMGSKPGGNQQGGPGGGGPDQRQGGGWGHGGPQGGGYGGGYNQQGGRGGFNQGQNQGYGGQQNFSNRGFNQRYNQGGPSYSGQSMDRNRPSRGNTGRGRNRGDPRPLIQYRDLDAPDDNDFF